MPTPEEAGNAYPDDVEIKSASPMQELGSTGLRRTSGYVDEEFLPALKGRKAIQIFREMRENDPIAGALLYAIDRLIRQIEWRVEAGSNDKDDKDAAEFVEQCMHDMSHTWDDFLSEILTMLAFGWSWHEIVYKKRVGPWEKNAQHRSKFDDKKIGWRKMPIRSQETWLRWVFDESGGVKAMIQLAPPQYEQTTIPIERSLLFRTSNVKNNPEGRSLLRNAYRPWYFKKRFEESEAIGVERDLAGLPVAKVPARMLGPNATPAEKQMVEAFKRMVRSVRRDEQEGLVLPLEYDQDTKQALYEFELLASAGGKQYNTSEIIRRYEERMLMCVLADFILVGHQGTTGGSYALHTDKSGLFRAAVDSIAQTIADTLNKHAIPRLFAVNGWKPKNIPQIVPGAVDPPNLSELSAFMGQLASAGVQWFPDPELEKFLRSAAHLPEMDEDAEKIKETEQKQSDIMRLAQQQMELMNMQAQAEAVPHQMRQQEMQTEQQEMGLEQQKLGIQQQANDTAQSPEEQMRRDEENHQMGLAQQQQKMKHEQDKQKLTLQQQKQKMTRPPKKEGKK